MSEYNKNGLEDFFKSKLNEKLGTPGWNVPGDDLFDRAMDQIDEQSATKVVPANKNQKSKRRYLPFILVIGGLLISTLYFWNQHNLTAKSLEDHKIKLIERNQKIDALKAEHADDIKKHQSLVESIQSKEIENNSVEETTQRNQSTDRSEKTQRIETTKQKDIKKSVSATKAKMAPPINTHHQLQNENVFPAYDQASTGVGSEMTLHESSNNQIDANQANAYSGNQNQSTVVTTPEMISLDQLTRNSELPLFVISDRDIEQTPEYISQVSEESSKMQVAAQVAFVQSAFDMSELPNADYVLTGYDKYSNGYAFGLKLSKPISNRFYLATDLNINKLNNQSQYINSLDYNTANVYLSQNGSALYHNEMEIMSPMGRFAMDDMIEMDESIPMVDNDEMENKTAISQSFMLSSLSLNLGTKVFNSNGLSLNAEFGPNINYVFADKTTLNSTLSYNNSMLSNYNSVSATNLDEHALSLSVRAAVILDYQFSPRWSVFASGGFQKNLSAFMKSSTMEPSSSCLKLRSISTGLNYRF